MSLPAVGAEIIGVHGGRLRALVVVNWGVVDFDAASAEYNVWVYCLQDEGITWARGWDTPEANALRAAVALAQGAA